ALLLGRPFARLLFGLGGRLGSGAALALALALCFGFAFLANVAGLAPIVGAFAAGLLLDEALVHGPSERAARPLRGQLAPLAPFLVPVFFVLMGMRVELAALGHGIAFALVLTLAAVLGKQVCALGVLTPRTDRLAVGLGMIPRGEVGLIFASLGASLTLHGE